MQTVSNALHCFVCLDQIFDQRIQSLIQTKHTPCYETKMELHFQPEADPPLKYLFFQRFSIQNLLAATHNSIQMVDFRNQILQPHNLEGYTLFTVSLFRSTCKWHNLLNVASLQSWQKFQLDLFNNKKFTALRAFQYRQQLSCQCSSMLFMWQYCNSSLEKLPITFLVNY